MADVCSDRSSTSSDKSSVVDWNYDIISNHIALESISYDGKRLVWHDSYETLQKFIITGFVQRGKWCSPGGGSKRFDSHTSDFIVTWYPGKLNSLIFGGTDGEKSKNYLINNCLKPVENVHRSNSCCEDFKACMDDFKLDTEILQSRVDSVQSFISSWGNQSPTELGNEVARLRSDLEEEKIKNSFLTSEIKHLNEELNEIKSFIHYSPKDVGKPIEPENNDSFIVMADTHILHTDIASKSQHNQIPVTATEPDNNDPSVVMVNTHILHTNVASKSQHIQIPVTAIESEDNDQSIVMVDTHILHTDVASKSQHIQVPDIANSPQHKTIKPSNSEDKRPNFITNSSLDSQLKEYRIKHNSQRINNEYAKSKEGINILENDNKVLNPQSNNESSNFGKKLPFNLVKGTVPCPFLKRRGWCVKGNRCDFEHPRDEEKHLVPCPFLQKRGFCLKGIKCDFSHKANLPHNILPSRSVNNYTTSPVFQYHRPPMVSKVRTHGVGVSQCSQRYPWRLGSFKPHPKPLMEIFIPHVPSRDFHDYPNYRAQHAETLV